MDDAVFDMTTHPVHLGLGATVSSQPAFTGEMAWYEDYAERTAADAGEGRLVSFHTFDRPWDTWEVHPQGEELVVCLAGRLVLHQERDGAVETVTLHHHRAVVNPAGVWHTADIEGEASALFITAGLGNRGPPPLRPADPRRAIERPA